MTDLFSPPTPPAPPPVRPDPALIAAQQQAQAVAIQNTQTTAASDLESLLSRYGALLGTAGTGKGPTLAPVVQPTTGLLSGGLRGRGRG